MRIFKKRPSAKISPKETQLIKAMHLLGDPTRYKMFNMLMVKDGMCVTDIAEQLDVTLSAISQHFHQLELVGLVGKERMGQKVCYVLNDNDDLVRDLVAMLKKRR